MVHEGSLAVVQHICESDFRSGSITKQVYTRA